MKASVAKALNDQLNAEFASAHLYLSMSAYFQAQNLEGMAHWMALQYQEEMGHTMKFFKYLNDRGCRVHLEAVPAPQQDWDSPQAVFETTLGHEEKVTQRIHALVDLATADKDHATTQFLQWYVMEQVEEEAMISKILARMKLASTSPQLLLFLDRELGSRMAR